MTRKTASFGRGIAIAVIIALLMVTALIVVGEMYSTGARPQLASATDDGLPVQLDGSEDEIRNVSIGLGGLGASVLLVTALYWIHTGRLAKERLLRQRAEMAERS